MKIATDGQHRALAFIAACNGSGYSPARDEVDAWLREPVSTGALAAAVMRFSVVLEGAFGRSDTLDHLLKLGWITESPSLGLTELGRALLGARSGPSQARVRPVSLFSIGRIPLPTPA